MRRPFLSLFFCLALAVNLLAPFVSAHPLFIQICTGHGIVLVASEDTPDEPGPCEMCPVACATALTPEGWTHHHTDPRRIRYEAGQGLSVGTPTLPAEHARAPPSLST